jgi:hypothetical protein
MSKLWVGIGAGLLAGAAGATAKNAVSFVDQAAQGDPPPSSPHAAEASGTAAAAVSGPGHELHSARASALGSLAGLGIGVGIGAAAGALRGVRATPNPAVAAIATGLAAMAVGEGAAVASGNARSDWASPANLLRDLVAHLAYGATTGYALHRLLDPHTPRVARIGL